MEAMIDIAGTPYSYEAPQQQQLVALADRVADMRSGGKLDGNALRRLRTYFRIKNIYHSNAIEGNQLNVGETREVVERGLTITGKPLKDQAEARNLAAAIDFLEELAKDNSRAIREYEIREIHSLILKGIDDENAGRYRSVTVEISGSKYKPPQPENIPAQMEGFTKWLAEKSCCTDLAASFEGIINAAVAHTWLVYVHPFIDGNGRVARLLMNLMLMRCWYPIAIITREDRLRYYDALETSQHSDLSPFLSLLSECVNESLEEYESAVKEQREQEEWARSLAEKFTEPERVKASNEYEVWRSAMELLKSYVRQTSAKVDAQAMGANVYFHDFGMLDFEKYLSLRSGESAKKTWFFRVDFVRAKRSARYLFFFGFSSPVLRDKCYVTLHVAREEPPGSYYYERLDQILASNVPALSELGYDARSEKFVARYGREDVETGKIEVIGRRLFEQVVKLHFSN